MTEEHTQRTIKTALGPLCLMATDADGERHAEWLRRVAEIAATSETARELFARAGLSGCPIRFVGLGIGTGGDFHHLHGIRLNPFASSFSLATTLVHETTHLEQYHLGLDEFRPGISLADYLLETCISEAAAFTLETEARWEMSRTYRGRWATGYAASPLLCLNMDWQMLRQDNPQTRAAARAAAFKAFFSDVLGESYETRSLARLQGQPAEKIREMLTAPSRPREEYDALLAANGLPGLRDALPDLDWNAPFWCGMSYLGARKLKAIIAEKCPDLADKVPLPPVSHHVPRPLYYLAATYAFSIPVLKPFL